jgi:hypothetical protein
MKVFTRLFRRSALTAFSAALLSLAGAATVAVLPAGPAAAQAAQNNDDAVKAGTETAKQWVKLVDDQQYDKTWDHVGKVFKSSFKQADWSDMLKKGRDQLGTVKKRELGKAEFITELPGAPKGEYVVVTWNTEFQNQPEAINEIVVATRESAQWKVVGYSMRPKQ